MHTHIAMKAKLVQTAKVTMLGKGLQYLETSTDLNLNDEWLKTWLYIHTHTLIHTTLIIRIAMKTKLVYVQ